MLIWMACTLLGSAPAAAVPRAQGKQRSRWTTVSFATVFPTSPFAQLSKHGGSNEAHGAARPL
jgi:hypothetical protein